MKNEQLLAYLERVACFLADPVCADDGEEITLLRAETASWLNLHVAQADLTPMPEGRPELLRDACLELISTIHVTGGLTVDDHGCDVPVADPEWPDLGAAYLLACEALGEKPSYAPGSEPEAEEIEQEDLEAASEVLDHLEAGRLQCGCDPSSCDHKYLGDEPGPYPRDRREKKGT